ncbi:MAG: bifunctional riboflavin kinase/FAD synthetase [Nitriliruptoraceae bacterium]
MTVAYQLADVDVGPSVVTIGNFDGVHRGHQVLLRRTVDAGLSRDIRSVAITFDPHPAVVVRPGSQPKRLTTLDDKIELLRDHGVDLVVVLPFTRQISMLSPQQFIQHVLIDQFDCRRVIIGTNFRFGTGASGDIVTMSEDGRFEVEGVSIQHIGGKPVSSSAIRDALAAGDVEFASAALGRPYRLAGEVVRGDGRGRTIGVPTANLAVPEDLAVPANGVYAGRATVDNRDYLAAVNIGVRPTVAADNARTVEAHLIDFTGDLYGRSVPVTFEQRLRAEQSFPSVDALVAQIHRDIEHARRWGSHRQPQPR